MVESGLFIPLYDEDTLKLYLKNGIYGQLMSIEPGKPSPWSVYYPTLADYACCREENHVFFFRKREICYGGQIMGSKEFGSFFLNGQLGPIGRNAKAPLVWDESKRECYKATNKNGVFFVNEDKRCQHFLIRFQDNLKLKGKCISSDQLYFKLGEFPYPLPSNSIEGMGFCTITPGETKILIDLFQNEPSRKIEPISNEDIKISKEPLQFSKEFLIDDLKKAETESHLEASVAANPNLLPKKIQPINSAICRQVPISPKKPSQMDLADLCYFSERSKGDGTIPDTVIELKNKKAGKTEVKQVVRYLEWLEKLNRIFNVETEEVKIYLLAPDYTSTVYEYIPSRFSEKVELMKFDDNQ